MHLVSKVWILFLKVRKQGPCFTAVEEDGGDKRPAFYDLFKKKKIQSLCEYLETVYTDSSNNLTSPKAVSSR